MSKTVVIAVREYLAAVKTKGFIAGLILMPLLMGGGVAMQSLTRDIEDPRPRTIAVLDKTPGELLLKALQVAARTQTVKLSDGRSVDKYVIEPAPSLPDAHGTIDLRGDPRLLAFSDRLRKGDLTAFVEADADALAATQPTTEAATPADASPATAPAFPPDTLRTTAAMPAAEDGPASHIYFTTNRPALIDVREFVATALQPLVLSARIGESPDTIKRVTQNQSRVLEPRGLARRTPDGAISFEPRSNEIAQLVLPSGMVVIMFMVVLVGASPLTTNIIEEKQLRIAEVLVGSVTPFSLMLGKLIGGVATSLTLGVIYVAGAAGVAGQLGVLNVLTPGIVVWFVVFTVVASMMYGALFVVAGAAATNVKEAQSLMTPMMLLVVLPLFLLGPLASEPHGLIGLAGTFFPLTAPMVVMMRLTTPPPIAWWQPVLALVSSGLLTLALVWVAGRVFRAGFLLVGRPAKFRELVGWILKG